MKTLKKIYDGFKTIEMKYRIIILCGMLFCLLMSILSMCTSCSIMNHYKDDNDVEEFLEDVIKDKTGVDIDISPLTPEKK